MAYDEESMDPDYIEEDITPIGEGKNGSGLYGEYEFYQCFCPAFLVD